jgi:ribonuclease HII
MKAALRDLPREPGWEHEDRLCAGGTLPVAGIDEVGRGPIAGAVAAGAVILDPRSRPAWWSDLRDSKLLTPQQRERLAGLIWREAVAVGVGSASPREIDTIGIAPASRLAMLRAIAMLPVRPGHLLLDAFPLPESDLPQTPVLYGDRLCVTVAAASIVAKVARDRWMAQLDGRYPGYGFAAHKGYASPEHLAALDRLGPCPLHRRSFRPDRFLQFALDFGTPAAAGA